MTRCPACAGEVRDRAAILPPYSPDLNPLEVRFAKLRALLRTAGRRTVEGLWHMVGGVSGLISATEYPTYFRQGGCPATYIIMKTAPRG
jgi:transposase